MCFASLSFGQTTPPEAKSAPASTPPSGVEVEVGIVGRVGGPNISNYSTQNSVLSLTNLGSSTPQLLAGLGFMVCGPDSMSSFCTHTATKSLGAFVSAQFGSGSNQAITGYSLGATIGISQHLRGLIGFSLTPVSEVTPGFLTAASQYVGKNPSLFPGIDPAKLAANGYNAFDGIQFTNTVPAAGSAATSTIYYPGSPTTNHYRGGLIIGVALPINIYNLIAGNKTGGQ
jgi:hypothetical protein